MQNEVDFVVTETFGSGIGYEVKFSDARFRPKNYKKFQADYPGFRLECISYESAGKSIPVLKI